MERKNTDKVTKTKKMLLMKGNLKIYKKNIFKLINLINLKIF